MRAIPTTAHSEGSALLRLEIRRIFYKRWHRDAGPPLVFIHGVGAVLQFHVAQNFDSLARYFRAML